MSDYIKNRKDRRYDSLLALIPVGEENARSMSTLARLTDLEERAVRQWVEDARLSGLIIASSQSGYYIPVDEAELCEYYVRTKRRGETTLNTLRAVERKLGERI